MQNRHLKLLALTLLAVLLSVAPAAAQAPTPPYRLFLPVVSRPAQVQVLAPTADAFVIENLPNENTGSDAFLVAGLDLAEQNPFGRMRTLIKFDVAQGASPAKATLRLYLEDVVDTPDTTQSLVVLQPNRAWNESTVTFANHGGCSTGYSSDPIATVPVNSSGPKGYIDIDVTSVVSNWAVGFEPNNGFCILKPEGAAVDWSYYLFTSREGENPPQLVLTR